MEALLIFASVLVAAVLLSKLASRSIISTSVLFLAAGFFAGDGMLNITSFHPSNPVIQRVAELALFSVLFTDGMRIGVRQLAGAWRLPGRALLYGMPLTLIGTVLIAKYLTHFSWLEALLVGAVLAPTDPVFAAALVGRQEVPRRLRHLLNVESGLNDGLALPIVLTALMLMGVSHTSEIAMLVEVLLGILLGIGIPWIVLWLESSRLFEAHKIYEPILAFSIALLTYAVASVIHGNLFLAAFFGGVAVASLSDEAKEEFHHFGEIVSELLKLAALFLFGSLISPTFFLEFGLGDYVFVLLVLVMVRPIAIGIALYRSELYWKERFAAAWFGPKGFASVVYGLLVLKSGVSGAEHLFHLIAIVIAISIIAHSSTDVFIADSLQKEAPGSQPKKP
jgi:NhaP-type Na+/H+ or K+/H+ antiporter